MTKRRMPAFGAVLVLTTVAQAVMAQTTPAAPAAPAATAATAAAEPAPAAAKASTPAQSLDAVTITVNKREERLQDVPMAASVVQAQQLDQQNIEGVGGLTRAVATVSQTLGGLTIRGFGAQAVSSTAEGSVGILLDGVSLAGAGSSPPNFFDVERVEVLEGPQGTLFGKSSTAGVINIVSRAPSTKAFDAAVRTETKSRDGRSLQGMVNVPLGDKLALRFAGSAQRDPSTVHNLLLDTRDEVRRVNGRVRLKWDATSNVKVNLIADRTQTKVMDPGGFAMYSSTPGTLLSNQLAACGVRVSDENTDTCGGTAAKKRNTIGGVSAQVDWALGDYTLTSVTARRKVDDDGGRVDLDSIPLPSPSFFQTTDQHYKNFSQEIRLASPDADWGNFVAGLYYFNGDINGSITQEYMDPALFGPFLIGQTSRTIANVKDLAVFGQGTYRLTKDWSLNLGARWGRGQANASRALTLAPGAIAGFSSLAPVTGSISDSYTSWRVGTQYEFTPSNVGYVSFVQGYKGSAVNENASDPSIPLVVRPEIPRVLEAGMKNVFLDGRFAMNVAAYHSTIKDFQAQIFNPTNAQFVFSNAPEARTHGVSLSFYGRPTKAFTVNGGAAYTIAQYGPGYFTPCGAASAPGCVRSAEHDQVSGAPRFRATLAAEYVIPVGTLKAAFAGDVVYQSKQVFNPTDPMRNFEPRTTIGARVGLHSQDDKWGVSLYVRNLLDDFQPSFRTNNILGFVTGDNRSYFQAVGADARRLFGLTFDAKF